MTTEAILAYFHLLAIFTLIVFLTSEAALCRPEWMNADVVRRLALVDRVYGIAAGAVLLTGLARIYLGAKGAGWYWGGVGHWGYHAWGMPPSYYYNYYPQDPGSVRHTTPSQGGPTGGTRHTMNASQGGPTGSGSRC